MAENNFHLAQQLCIALKEHKIVLALAESCTGGGIADQLTAVPDYASWFDRGFVTYSNAAKIEMLGVDPKLIEVHGAVSAETAMAMAKGAIKHSHADVSLSVTGIAGPDGGSIKKPVGTVYFGLADKHGLCESRLANFTSGRKQIRVDSVSFAFHWLLSYLNSR